MVFPTSIHESNVLDGIADAVAIIRSPLADNPEAEETITFDTGQNNPPLLYFDQVIKRNREFRDGTIDLSFLVRPRIVFNLPFLTAAEAAKWRKVWNAFMAGYQIIMRPHNDSALKLEWPVCPTPGTAFVLNYFAGKYFGHSCELSFTGLRTESAMNLSTSAVSFQPLTIP